MTSGKSVSFATCFICAEPAGTDEHVIPKWLQHRFDLWDQKLTLPNGTDIPYRQLTVPACSKCNSDIYGVLEHAVENGSASDADVWKWACKIHYGLGYKHKFLAWDRKNPIKKINEYIKSNDPLGIERLFLLTVSEQFKTNPDPFGSVFRFDFDKEERFVFAHFFQSSSICISFGSTGYVIFLKEGQTLKNNIGTCEQYKELNTKGRVEDMLFFYANCVENFERQKMGQDIMLSKDTLVKVGGTVVHSEEPFNVERFRKVCDHLGLNWVDEGSV